MWLSQTRIDLNTDITGHTITISANLVLHSIQLVKKKKKEGLEEIVELTGKRALEVGIETVKRILLHVLDFIPRVKNSQVCVSPGKRKLDTETAVHSASSAFAAGCSDSTILLVEAHKVGVPLAGRTPVSLPEEVLKPTFLKLHHLTKRKMQSHDKRSLEEEPT